MIGLDTNVLLRFLIRDDEAQAARADRMIRAAGEGGVFVSLLVLVEAVWALKRVYGLARPDIVDSLESVLSSPAFVIEHATFARYACAAFASADADFADALIGEVNRAAGCSATATFDRRTARLDGFRKVP